MIFIKHLRRFAQLVGLAGTCHALLAGCSPPEYDFDPSASAGANQGGSAASAGGSQGGAAGSEEVPATCKDGIQNQDETDVDCGGDICNFCEAGERCRLGTDCVDGICTNGVCMLHTCSDGVHNGMETDVDCGGECKPCDGGGGGSGGDGGGAGTGGEAGAPDRECEGDDDCDDDNECTDDACVGFTCQHTNNTAPCASDDVDCTVDVCSGGACTHEPDDSCACYSDADCDDGNVCTDETCVNYTCVPTNNSNPCASDNVACTVDICSGGTCTHQPDGSCECLIDDDCNDSNLCTDDACIDYSCEHVPNDDPCASDGIDCTTDVCSGGSCTHQPDGSCECLAHVDCDDSNPCTTDTCVNHACQHSNNSAPCASDGIACTNDVCSGGSCTHQVTAACECVSDAHCNDGNPCTDDACVAHACQYTNNTAPCAGDGIDCTLDVCSGSECTHQFDACDCQDSADCDDGNPCTDEVCSGGACQITNNTAPCAGDGIGCTDDVCSGGQCTHQPTPACECLNDGHCDDGNVCTDDSCVDFACVRQNNTAGCASDGISCTTDVCSGGECTHEPDDSCECLIDDDCDDDNVCTDDACFDYSCETSNNSDPCAPDGIDCTDDICNAGSCTHPPTLSCECINHANCNDANSCTDDQCVNFECVFTNNMAGCASDGIACTTDVCSGGSCVHNPTASCECDIDDDCDDDNPCTDDACFDYACETSNNSDPCESDGIDCTLDVCSGGDCVHNPTASCQCDTPEDCNDNNPCTDDDCQNFACVYQNNTAPCASDGNECTNDVCSAGTCTHPPRTGACTDDGDTCTSDQCIDGVCTHTDTGRCNASNFVAIRTNRDDNYVLVETERVFAPLNRYIIGSGGNMGSITMSWDEAGLYFFFDIADNTPFDDSAMHWEDDSVEIYLDLNNGKSATYQSDDHQITIARTATDIQGNNTANHGAITVVRSSDASGYTLDVTIPWSALNLTGPLLDQNIGIDFAVNNDTNGGTRETQTMVFGTTNNHTNTSAWGSITLNGGQLQWTGATLGEAAVFEKIDEVGSRFLLRDDASGQYVALDVNDDLGLVTNKAAATWFEANPCDAPFVGLRAVGDIDGVDFILADDGNVLSADRETCGAGNANSWQKFELIPITESCDDAEDCADDNPCTDEDCVGGFCFYTDNSNACASDGDSCTEDLCITGTCTHLPDGSCEGTDLITIWANHDNRWVVLNGIYLEDTGISSAEAAIFERVSAGATLFRLRADATGQFVRLSGAADELTADATFAQATIFDSYSCTAPLVALEAVTDNDDQRVLTAPDGTNRLQADRGNCSPTAGSWEKFRLFEQ